ncbi:MAG: prepilin peptidase [Rhodospirillaceae bacterium]
MFILSGLAFAGLLIAAAVSDIRSNRIPNVITGALILVFAISCASGLYRPAAPHLIAFAVAFAIGSVLFHAKLWGGGDAKLLAATGLYLEPYELSALLLITALAGGAMAAGLLLHQRIAGGAAVGQTKIPYGVALATGGLAVGLRGML